MAFLRAADTLSGSEGTARANIGGEVVDLFYIKTFEASAKKKKASMKALGTRNEQHKATGWSGEGSMNLYYVTSAFRALAATYAKTGKDCYFTITVTNEDPGSSIGPQTLTFYDCNVNDTVLAKLDTGADMLDEDMDFTFHGFDILDAFGKPIETL